MILSVRYQHLSPSPALKDKIEELLLPLGEHCRLDEAEVLISHRIEGSPAYAARVKVAVPVPDLLVEIADHTPENAYGRAVEEINRKLRERSLNRARQRVTGRKHAKNFRVGRRSR